MYDSLVFLGCVTAVFFVLAILAVLFWALNGGWQYQNDRVDILDRVNNLETEVKQLRRKKTNGK